MVVNDQLVSVGSYKSQPKASNDLIKLAEFGRISAALIHELSTPLSAAVLLLDQMSGKDRSDISKVRRNLRTIERYVIAARKQLRGDVNLVSFSLTVAIHRAAMLVNARAKAANIKLLINTIGSLRLYGDPIKFQQIIANLLSNAIDAYDQFDSARRIITIRVERFSKTSSVSISVTDYGVGISADRLNQVFTPFYSNKLDNRLAGMGIGLDIVRKYVVHDFSGKIRVVSSPKSGTQFKLTIPLKKP